jgi:hypothetical protein
MFATNSEIDAGSEIATDSELPNDVEVAIFEIQTKEWSL